MPSGSDASAVKALRPPGTLRAPRRVVKRTSCGVVVFSAEGEMLLCHLTGTTYWDLPKGMPQAGESDRDAAVRETVEETGLRLPADHLLDLGRFAYRPGKDLHLYAVLMMSARDAKLSCSSHFRDRWGRSKPEVDGYAWVAPAQVNERCAPSMARVLATIGLASLAQRLGASNSGRCSDATAPED